MNRPPAAKAWRPETHKDRHESPSNFPRCQRGIVGDSLISVGAASVGGIARSSEARAAIARCSKEELGLSGAEITRHPGVNTSSINRAIAQVERGEEN
jgi:hypothetical protein